MLSKTFLTGLLMLVSNAYAHTVLGNKSSPLWMTLIICVYVKKIHVHNSARSTQNPNITELLTCAEERHVNTIKRLPFDWS